VRADGNHIGPGGSDLVDLEIVRFSGLVKHEASRFLTARPTYATGSARNEIRESEKRNDDEETGRKNRAHYGGSRGIGAAIAKRLAADGASVAITYSKDAKRGFRRGQSD